PAPRAAPRTQRRARSYLDVVAVLEDPGAGKALDPVRRVEAEVPEPEASWGHDGRCGQTAPRGDPVLGDSRMRALEPPQQGGPLETPTPPRRGALPQPRPGLGEDLLRHRELARQRLGRAGKLAVSQQIFTEAPRACAPATGTRRPSRSGTSGRRSPAPAPAAART